MIFGKNTLLKADAVKELFQKYRAVIAYLFFGGCSMLVNIAAYYVCYDRCGIGNVVSTAIAWIAAVIVAFITNKLWVFESSSFSGRVFFRELIAFFVCRIATGLLDLAVMYIAVDRLELNELLWKLISNIVVIILNYVASKLLIFRNGSGCGR